MATAKSNRSARRFAGAPARGGTQMDPHRLRAAEEAPRAPDKPDWLRDLSALGLRLRVIYGTAITAELALRRHAGGQDQEIADCLREGVCNPLSDEIAKFDELIRRFETGVFLAKRSPTFNEWLNAVLAAAPPA